MAESDVILEVRDLHIWYGSFRGSQGRDYGHRTEQGHRTHRPLRMWEEHPCSDASTG